MAGRQLLISFLLCLYTAVISQASVIVARFKPKVINTTWTTDDGQLLHDGALSTLECTSRCTSAADNCYAIHLTSNGKCFLIKEKGSWKEERPISIKKFWTKGGPPDTQASLFPYSFQNSRYYFNKTAKKNWNEAAAFCESIGANLAQISTEAELQFIWNIMNTPTANVRHVFIGGYKVPGDGLPHTQGWKWRGTEEPVDSSLWQSPQQPDNAGGNQYVTAFWHGDLRLHDASKSLQEKFLCEYKSL